nr:glycosyltransferase [Flavihumibacter rivuli]
MLTERGHTVTVFVSDHQVQSYITKENYQGINVIRFNPGMCQANNQLGYSASLSYQFSEIVINEIRENGKPDFIETQDYHGIGYYLILKKKLGEETLVDTPIILTAHSPSFDNLKHNQSPVYDLPGYWTGEMEKWIMKSADILISPSEFMVTNLKNDLGTEIDRYHVVRNPYSIHQPIKHNIRFEEGDIAFFGKLTYQKGGLHLIKQMSNLWDNGFDKSLNIIGDDHYFEPRQMSMKEYLTKKYKRHVDSGRIKFEGKISPDQINDRLSKAQLIIVPSLVDNFPYAVVESMLLGKVVITSNAGGQAEMIEDGKSGFIYELHNQQSFEQKLHEALTKTEKELAEIGQRAIQRIKELCSYENVYKAKMDCILSGEKLANPNHFPFVYDIEKSVKTKEKPTEKGLLSVIVPYYNSGKFLEETIDSIYQTSYPSKEVIVVNDGTDEIESLTKLYLLQEKYGFKVINQPNQGLPSARNTGILNARGEYVAYLDADDKIDPHFYERAIKLLEKYPNVSFVASWVKYFYEAEGIWPCHIPEPPFLLIHNMVHTMYLCRADDFLNFGMNDNAFEYGMEDYDANISLLKNGCRGVVIPEPLLIYRVHSTSMSRGFNRNNMLYLYRLLSHKHADFYSRYAKEIFNLLMANGPSYLYDNPTLKPYTDVMEYRKRVEELEKANSWYQNTLNYLQETHKNGNRVQGNEGLEETSRIILHSPNQAEEIKQWYHKEYEVLPLWYKRFGHIIKVFQGHRSLKSLFID